MAAIGTALAAADGLTGGRLHKWAFNRGAGLLGKGLKWFGKGHWGETIANVTDDFTNNVLNPDSEYQSLIQKEVSNITSGLRDGSKPADEDKTDDKKAANKKADDKKAALGCASGAAKSTNHELTNSYGLRGAYSLNPDSNGFTPRRFDATKMRVDRRYL